MKTTLIRKPDASLTDREFFLRSFTLGLPVNLGGAAVALCLLATGHKPKRFGNCVHFSVGKGWGGGSMGIFMVTCRDATQRLKEHEHGHSIQNCFYGPLMPLVNLQSSTRYLYRKGVHALFPKKKLPPYDSAWYEGEATRLGSEFMSRRSDNTRSE